MAEPSPAPAWADHANGVMLTSRQCSELLGRLASGGPKELQPGVWNRYQSRWRGDGLIPGPKVTYGSTHLYDEGEVTYWALHRPGTGRAMRGQKKPYAPRKTHRTDDDPNASTPAS